MRGRTRAAGHEREYASPSWRPHRLCGTPEEIGFCFSLVCSQLKRCEWAATVRGHTFSPFANGQRRRSLGFLTCIALACAIPVCGAEASLDHSCFADFSCRFPFLNAKTDIILHKNSFTSVVRDSLECRLFGVLKFLRSGGQTAPRAGYTNSKNTLT